MSVVDLVHLARSPGVDEGELPSHEGLVGEDAVTIEFIGLVAERFKKLEERVVDPTELAERVVPFKLKFVVFDELNEATDERLTTTVLLKVPLTDISWLEPEAITSFAPRVID